MIFLISSLNHPSSRPKREIGSLNFSRHSSEGNIAVSEDITSHATGCSYIRAAHSKLLISQGHELEELEQHLPRGQATEEVGKWKLLSTRVETLKVELENYKADEEGRQEQKKKAFLKLLEFYNLLDSHSFFMLEHGFEGAVRQVQEVRHLSTGTSLDVLDPKKVLDNILEGQLID